MTESLLKTTRLTKIIADFFYITFLSNNGKNKEKIENFSEYISNLNSYIDPEDGVFNVPKFIRDTKKKGPSAEIIFNQLLPSELLSVKKVTLDEIDDRYKAIKKSHSEGGYVRAVLEVLFDSQYQEGFANRAKELKLPKLNLKKNAKEEKFYLTLIFMKNCLSIIQRKNLETYVWDYSFTSRKSVKKNIEKLNNPYSAYKLYAQCEYSKLLIGYEDVVKNSKELPALSQLIKDGYLTILTSDETAKSTITKMVIENGVKKKKDTEISIIPYKQLQKLNFTRIEKDKMTYNSWRKYSKIFDLQNEEINSILQKFNEYVPYSFDEVKNPIHKICSKLFFKHCRDTENFDGTFFSHDEIHLINDTYTTVAIRIGNCELKDRRKINARTKYVFDKGGVSIDEKVLALWNLINSDISQKYPSIGKELDTLKEKVTWQTLIGRYTRKKSSSIDTEEDGFRLEEVSNTKDEVIRESVESHVTEIENDYDCKKLSKLAKKVVYLFKEQFPQEDEEFFVDNIYQYILKIEGDDYIDIGKKKHVQNLNDALKEALPDKKEKITSYMKEKIKLNKKQYDWKDIKDNLCSKSPLADVKNEEILERVRMSYAFRCLDKEHSWEGTFNFYKNCKDEEINGDNSPEINEFRKKMNKIYKSYRQLGNKNGK